MLAKIFSPVIKLWNWIKETAWIQPLLIVGIVFGIIFSISPIVKACSNMNAGEEYNFYNERKVSLEKIYTDYENSDGAKLLENIFSANENFKNDENPALEKLESKKFFLMFYSEECEACKNSSEAFKYLNDNWQEGYFKTGKEGSNNQTANEEFKMYTIDTLEKATNKDNKEELAFTELLDKNPLFFEKSGSEIFKTPSYINDIATKDNLTKYMSGKNDEFLVPSILLVDFTQPKETFESAFKALMFGVNGKSGGSGAADKAMTLMDCWNGDGDFALNNNNK